MKRFILGPGSARSIGVLLAAFVGMPLVTTSSCASSDESAVFAGGTGGKDAATGKGGSATGGSGGTTPSGGGGSVATGGGGLGGTATGGSGGTGGGTCNPQTCPTPAAPATKCCVTSNGPCGVDYKQGAGCQSSSTGDI